MLVVKSITTVNGVVTGVDTIDVADLMPTVDQGAAGASPWLVAGTIDAAQSGVWSVGVSSLPALPAGANTIGKVDQGAPGATAWPVSLAGSVAVTGTFWQATQPVSAASLPLPAGAATAAKQPAPGTAGTASADVITVQGVAGGTALPVSAGNASGSGTITTAAGSAVTLAVSGYAGLAVEVRGSWTGTLQVQGSVDGTNYDNLPLWLPTGNVNLVGSIGANGTYLVSCAGMASLKVLGPTSTGSATVTLLAVSGPAVVALGAPLPSGSNVVGAVTQSGTWTVTGAGGTFPVTGTFWQATQPVSIAATLTVDTELPAAVALADATATPTTPLIGACELLFNGATWDMRRGMVSGTGLASATRTGSASFTITNISSRNILVWLNVTAASGTGGLTVQINAADPVSGNLAQLNANPTAVVATGLTVYELGPDASGTASGGITQSTKRTLPRALTIGVAHGNASSYTYSVGYTLLP